MNARQKKLQWVKRVSPALYNIAMALLCVYIGLRASRWLDAVLPFSCAAAVFGILLVYYVLNLMMIKKVPFTRNRGLCYALSTGTFCVMYLTMALLLTDTLQWIAKHFVGDTAILRRLFVICGFLCLAAVVCAVIAGVHHAGKIVTVHYESLCSKLKEDKRIVLLTDLHIGYFVGSRHIRKIVEKVNSLQPDMVLISGDLFNGGGTGECAQLNEAAAELSRMKPAEGTFAVTGNHDPDPGEESFRAFLRRADIRLLEDEAADAGGVELIGRSTKTRPRKPLRELMDAADGRRVTVVLDHDPIGISEARKEGADYVLCGHTHKGQVFPLNFFVRLIYRKDETWGMTKRGGTTSVVSSGAGFFSMPMRIGSDSEVVAIDLKACPSGAAAESKGKALAPEQQGVV